MDQFQADLLAAALARREAASLRGATKEQFIARMENEGGFVYGGFCGRGVCETEIKDKTKATDSGPARSGVPLTRGADPLHVVRPAQRGRGRVGEGVLGVAAGQRDSGTVSPTELLFADAGLARRGDALLLAATCRSLR